MPELYRFTQKVYNTALSNLKCYNIIMLRKFLLGSAGSACACAAGVAGVARLDEAEAARQAEATLPREYSPEPFERFWGGQHRCVAARRVFEIGATLAPFALRAAWHYNVRTAGATPGARRSRPGGAWSCARC